MKNILITGSNGMIGGLILKKCLERVDVAQVTSITRKPIGIQHPKLKEIIHSDFLNYSTIEENFANQDICFYCIGVYTGQVSKDEFTKITVGFTKALGSVLKKKSEQAIVCFLSGAGADPKEKSRVQFARDKGMAENYLVQLGLKAIYIFRPGYIYPATKRREPNFSYRLMRALYKPLLSWIYASGVITSENLANAMIKVGFNGNKQTIFENKEIRKL